MKATQEDQHQKLDAGLEDRVSKVFFDPEGRLVAYFSDQRRRSRSRAKLQRK